MSDFFQPNFFLNPHQEAEQRRDQYFPALPSVGGQWGVSGVDYRGNQQMQPAMDNQVCCRVFADANGDITDSNGYYKVYKSDIGFGVGILDLQCEMRLSSADTLEDGDEVLGLMQNVTAGSPSNADDGLVLVKEILNANIPDPPQWVLIGEVGTGCSDSRVIWGWRKANGATCGDWNDGGPGGGVGTQMIVTHTQTADGMALPEIYTISFTVTPTGGSFNFLLGDGNHGPFNYNVTAAAIQATLAGAWTVAGPVGGPFVFTATDFFTHFFAVGDFHTLEPLPTDWATEANGYNFTCGISPDWHALLFKGGGDVPRIKNVKTRTDGVAIPVSWVLTESHVVGGWFTIKIDGYAATAPLRWNASAATIQTAINAVIAPDTCTVTGTAGVTYTITMVGFADHKIVIDKTGLFGDRYYRFVVPPFKKLSVVTSVSQDEVGHITVTSCDIFVASCCGDYIT